MWIKEPPQVLDRTLDINLNFLFNNTKFYIMDNHLAAPFCWLWKINVDNKYNLFHVDRHYDLLDSPNRVENEVVNKGINISNLELNDYLGLQETLPGGLIAKVFSWDNYILNFKQLYPELFNLRIFATHNDGQENEDFISKQIPIENLLSELEEHLESKTEYKWIINIDIDYFFQDVDNEYFQFFTYKFVEHFCKIVENNLVNIAVVTIAMSPENCGGLENSLRITKLFSQFFNLDFDISIN